MLSALFFTPSIMASRINRMVRAGIDPTTIRTAVDAAMDEAPGHIPTDPQLRARAIAAAFERALPLTPAEALARDRRARWKDAMGKKPKNVRTRATNAQERRHWLEQMRARPEHGLPVSREGFAPFKPHGERLVRDGLAVVVRSRDSWNTKTHATTRLHITPAGLAELERLTKAGAA